MAGYAAVLATTINNPSPVPQAPPSPLSMSTPSITRPITPVSASNPSRSSKLEPRLPARHSVKYIARRRAQKHPREDLKKRAGISTVEITTCIQSTKRKVKAYRELLQHIMSHAAP